MPIGKTVGCDMDGIYTVIFYLSDVLGAKPFHFQWVNGRHKYATLNKEFYYRPMVIACIFKNNPNLLSISIDSISKPPQFIFCVSNLIRCYQYLAARFEKAHGAFSY